MSIAAGDLNRLIQIEHRSDAKDELNQPVNNWFPFGAKRWGKMLTSTGYSAVKDNQTPHALVMTTIRFRYCPQLGITTGMRAVWKGQIFNIQQVRHDHATQEWTDLVCEIGGNNG